jgi:hypothetical protein
MAGNKRHSYSDEFIDRFIELYAKRGSDSLCIETLRSEYSQYPLLTSSSLARLRLKRKIRFENARSEHLIKAKKSANKRERDLLLRAKDLNCQTVEVLLDNQEDYIKSLKNIDREDEYFERDRLSLLRVITSLQKEINTFSGIDFQKSLNDFTQKLLRRKVIEEKDVDFLTKLLNSEGSEDEFENKKEAIPTLKFLESDDTN